MNEKNKILQEYLTPAVEMHAISTEGILCSSGGMNEGYDIVDGTWGDMTEGYGVVDGNWTN